MGLHKSPEELHPLHRCSLDTQEQFLKAGKVISLPKRHNCIRAQEENTNIYFILEGKVQIYNLTSCGKKKILFVLGPGNIANESIISDRNAIYCETLEPCRFWVMRREVLLSLMERDFQLTREVLAYQERKIWRLEHQLKNTAGSIYMERKLASKLLKLARDFGVQKEEGIVIDLELSITFLSDFLGAPRETTSRACKKLVEQGLIRVNRKRVTIPDQQALIDYYRNGPSDVQ